MSEREARAIVNALEALRLEVRAASAEMALVGGLLCRPGTSDAGPTTLVDVIQELKTRADQYAANALAQCGSLTPR